MPVRRGATLVLTAAALAACGPTPAGQVAAPAVPGAPAAPAVPGAPVAPPPTIAPPATPTRLAPFSPGSNCDLWLGADRVWWLENGYRPAPGPPAGGGATGGGAAGAVLDCARTSGALREVRLADGAFTTLETMDYWPFGLSVDEAGVAAWTGAPCDRPVSPLPSWLWRRAPGGPAVAVGPRDRHYRDALMTPRGLFATDGAARAVVRFPRDAGLDATPALVAPDRRVLAADATRFLLVDAAHAVWLHDRGDARVVARLDGVAMDAHLAGDLAVLRTPGQLQVVALATGTVRHALAIPSYGDRGAGALAGGFYTWADGRDGLQRLELASGARATLAVGWEACGVAVRDGVMVWADRAGEAVWGWRADAFDTDAR